MASVWESAGVMLPYLDMLNHKTGTAQLTRKLSDEEVIAAGRRGTVPHGRTRKPYKLYRSYGDLYNERLVLQYGFARGQPVAELASVKTTARAR